MPRRPAGPARTACSVPKTREPRALAALADFLEGIAHATGRPPLKLIPMLEDAGAVLDARAIALASPHVFGLITGSEDLATALGAEPDPDVLRFPKLMVHFAAKAAGVRSFGLLRTVADYNDLAGIEASAHEARRHGFDGRVACIRRWCRSSTACSRPRRPSAITRAP